MISINLIIQKRIEIFSLNRRKRRNLLGFLRIRRPQSANSRRSFVELSTTRLTYASPD